MRGGEEEHIIIYIKLESAGNGYRELKIAMYFFVLK